MDRVSCVYTYHPSHAETVATNVIGMFELGIPQTRTSIVKEDGITSEQMETLCASYLKIAEYMADHPDAMYHNFGMFKLSDRESLTAMQHWMQDGINTSACRAGRYKCFVNTDGNMYPCPAMLMPQFKLGNVFTQSFTRLSKLTIKQLSSEQCNKCEHRPGCQFCLYRSSMESGTVMYCSDRMKHYGEIKMRFMRRLLELCEERGLTSSIRTGV